MDYLHEYKYNHKVANVLETVFERIGWRFHPDLSSSASINCRIVFTDSYHNSLFLSEFPGNCSGLIIHEIENKPIPELKKIIDASVEVCKELQYALLFASGVRDETKQALIEMGFEIVLNAINYHSDRDNYFAVLRIEEEWI